MIQIWPNDLMQASKIRPRTLWLLLFNWKRKYLSLSATSLPRSKPRSPGGPSPTLEDNLPKMEVKFQESRSKKKGKEKNPEDIFEHLDPAVPEGENFPGRFLFPEPIDSLFCAICIIYFDLKKSNNH